MSSFRSKPELVKLFYRIGEVATIVGVQPHVLRYWETEFRTIRPQKSNKGQRIYSRRDVEKLIKVKDLLRNQGFTIAGARKVMRDQSDTSVISSLPEVTMARDSALEESSKEIHAPAEELELEILPLASATASSVAVAPSAAVTRTVAAAPTANSPRSAMGLPPLPAAQPERSAKRLRKALVELRQEVVSVLADLPPGNGGGSN
jgi:DNA-binding transcriptional MerR regulator